MPLGKQPIRFGLFEVNLETGEIRRDGTKVRLQEQPFQVLASLLEKPGEIVTKEGLQDRIWKDDTFVDFDRSLATAINKVRQALGDSATRPQYIETVAKRGYRFIGLTGQADPVDVTDGDEGKAAIPRRRLLALELLAAIAVILLAVLIFRAPEAQPDNPLRRFSFEPEGLSAASISPDGLKIAFSAQTDQESNLWLRTLGSETARRIPGTEGTRPEVRGWSPDSQSLAFATTNEVKRVNIDGGDPVTLCDLPGSDTRDFRGVSWSPDGERIVFSSQASLWEVPARGGEPRALLERGADVGDALQDPYFLPTGTAEPALLYTAGSFSSSLDSRIWVLNLESGSRRDLVSGAAPAYSSEGHLIYQAVGQDESGLRAVDFSLANLIASGAPFPIAGDGAGASVSHNGLLIYLDPKGLQGGIKTLVWRDRKGELLETIGQPQPRLREFALSPDRRRITTTAGPDEATDVWIQDLARSAITRLTLSDHSEYMPAWSPDGRSVVYTLESGGTKYRLMRTASDGTGEPIALVEADSYLLNADWSRDGRFLVYQAGWLEATSGPTGPDIRYIRLASDGTASDPETFLDSPAAESAPKLSPDGRFLAYVSNESGRNEVYMRPFPSGEGKYQASVNGGTQPHWRSDGKELYYVADRNTLMAVDLDDAQEIALGRPQRLFESSDLVYRNEVWSQYEVSADGQRILTSTPVQGESRARPAIRIVENWYEEFRDRE